MKKIKFIFKKFFSLNYKKMFETAKEIHKKTKKSRIYLFFDMIKCAAKYGAGYTDYYVFGFYDLNKKQRSTYLTIGINNGLVNKYNPKEYRSLFDDKIKFNQLFNGFLKRDWLDIRDNEIEFEKFISKHEKIAAKLLDECGGTGFEIIDIKKYKSSDELYKYLIDTKHFLIEEVAVQHNDLSRLYPKSINTVRIITVQSGGKLNFITAFLRIGNGGIVDNTGAGGMLSMIDFENGELKFAAVDEELNVYEKHPSSGLKIKGFKIPYWGELLEFTRQLAETEPRLRYVGWDIAIGERGPMIIEGNPYPAYMYQFSIFTPDKEGVLPAFKGLD